VFVFRGLKPTANDSTVATRREPVLGRHGAIPSWTRTNGNTDVEAATIQPRTYTDADVAATDHMASHIHRCGRRGSERSLRDALVVGEVFVFRGLKPTANDSTVATRREPVLGLHGAIPSWTRTNGNTDVAPATIRPRTYTDTDVAEATA
jgi:hypothetical protein